MEPPIEFLDESPDVETLMQQLRDPVTLLANALGRIHEADALTGAGAFLHNGDRAVYLCSTADTLAYIANAAADLAEAEQRRAPAEPIRFDEADMQDPAWSAIKAAVNAPLPISGVRFTADLRGFTMGTVAGREWLYAHGHGFIDISEAEEMYGPEGTAPYQITGRVVSATPDHALCITDGGASVTLPRALIVESPDERSTTLTPTRR